MSWQDILLTLLLPGVPATVLLLMFLSVIKMHVQVYIDGQPDQRQYLVCLENLDDVASHEHVELRLRIRGPGRFATGNETGRVGMEPWPESVTTQVDERTVTLNTKGMTRHERWLFEVNTDGNEQGVEVLCRIGRRELPVVASDTLSEYTDNPGASPLNAWLGLALSPLLYLGLVAASRAVQELSPRLEWVDAPIALGVLLISAFSLWVMRQPHQAVVAHPSTRPVFPFQKESEPAPQKPHSRLRRFMSRLRP